MWLKGTTEKLLTLADNETLLNNNGEVIKVLTDEVAVQKKKKIQKLRVDTKFLFQDSPVLLG